MTEDKTHATAFHDNLSRIIGSASVNSWAKSRGLDQSAIQRLVSGQDPRLSTIQKIADALGIQAWQLLVPGLDVDQLPELADAASTVDQAMISDLEKLVALAKGRMQQSPAPGGNLLHAAQPKKRKTG